MINLIPPKARKQITQEYWARVVSVWLFLASTAGLVTVLLAVPVYFLVGNINSALSGQFEEVKEEQREYEEVAGEVKEIDALVDAVSKGKDVTPFTDLLSALDDIAGSDIDLTQVVWTKNVKDGSRLSLVGIADTRGGLSGFVTGLNEHAFFEDADLPIANLAKDQDIRFSMTVTLSKMTR